jgi:hypothetical protein
MDRGNAMLVFEKGREDETTTRRGIETYFEKHGFH